MPGRKTTRITTILLPVIAAAVMICAGAGLSVTHRNDSRLESERHAALENALGELHAVFGDGGRFDSDKLRLLERRAGLSDMRFDAELTADSNREVQSLHDAQGRIIGWFSWAVDRAQSRAMDSLWSYAAALAGGLALCALLAAWATRRLASSLGRSMATVRRLTTQDVLTGLPNRRTMLEKLEDVLAQRRSGFVAYALIDLDSFYEINDTLGRAGGDALLASIAERLRSALPAGALLGRFADGEFAAMVSGGDAQTGAKLADTLTAALADPFYLDQMWQISAGVGIAQAPEDGTVADELSKRAALALRAAKRQGRATARRFVPQIQAEHAERHFLRRELELAIFQQAFEVHYQPVVAAAGSGIVGVEALLRWTHPTRGAIPPSMFIPLAEQGGLMNQLGEIALRRAVADAARWPDLFVSVNLSPVQMRHRNIVDLVGGVVAESGLTPSRLVLEVTEGILIDNPQETQTRLDAMRALGVRIALDDFGTGYSSLSYLQKFPFDRLKIDRAFVASLGTSGNTAAIIQSIVTLGHALGMKVLAEGVETDEQRVLLRLAGCDEMQGYLFAKAAAADVIERVWIKGRSPAMAAR